MPWKLVGTEYQISDGKLGTTNAVVEFEVEDEPVSVVYGGRKMVVWTKKAVKVEVKKNAKV